MGIDIVEALHRQAESRSDDATELHSLAVNVMNLMELVRVQNEALALAETVFDSSFELFDCDEVVVVQAALAKYNEMMGGER